MLWKLSTLKDHSHERGRQFLYSRPSPPPPPLLKASGATQAELDHNVRPDRDKAPRSELERPCTHQETDALTHTSLLCCFLIKAPANPLISCRLVRGDKVTQKLWLLREGRITGGT